jgi:hypothetical protein
MACDGDCDQVAYIDGCGECDDTLQTDCIDLTMELSVGANLISFYALPADVSVANIFSDIAYGDGDNGVMGEGVGTVFTEDHGWVGSLYEISQDDGYWVKVIEDATLLLEDSEPVSYDADGEVNYEMHYGNNLISYPFQTGQGISDALGASAGNLYAIAGEGSAALNTEDGWMGSLQTLNGGNGYWFVASADPLKLKRKSSVATNQ